MPRRRGYWVAATLLTAAGVAGCTNAPPPPLVSPQARTSIVPSPNAGEIVVGVDTVAGGFNPHKIADLSTITTALANLLLPSAYRTAPDGTPQLDRTLMVSAQVTKAEPYTVTYRIRPDASWSDGAPIAAEDFVYLWEQLRQEPGVLDAAGYRLVSNIASREAGKVVEVTFDKPYPGWRTLFSGLLPSHLVKDLPGGWSNVLADAFPATGGPFSVKTLDRDRGEVVLERNDRYWDSPAVLDQITLRRADQATLVDALGAGHDQLALTRFDSAGLARLATLGDTVAVRTVSRPEVAGVTLRPGGPDLGDVAVRQAAVAMLDRAAITGAGTGGGPSSTLVADAQVLPPSAPGYVSTLPAGSVDAAPDPSLASTLLGQAGYARPAGLWTRAGRPLRVVIAAAVERPAYVAMAKEVQRELEAAGVTTQLVTPTGELLYGRLLATPAGQAGSDGQQTEVDLVVGPHPAGGDPATALATGFGCVPDARDPQKSVPANPTGFCEPAVEPTIDAALTGTTPVATALTSVEPALWRQYVWLPLFQQADTLVYRPEMSGVTSGPPMSGPFADAALWRRSTG